MHNVLSPRDLISRSDNMDETVQSSSNYLTYISVKLFFSPSSLEDFAHYTCNCLTLKAPNTTIAEFAYTVDPDETAHDEPSHLDLQCLPSSF